jgi:segregation and condensation protein B
MAKKTPSDLSPKLQVEALLFSSGKTMSEEQLGTLTGLDQLKIKGALQELQSEYSERDSAITIFSDPTGWKMMVRDKYVPVVKNIVADTELSRATMETLAVIAYKYPKVLQSEVIDIRGSGAYEHMAELERLGFIRRDPEGRSYAVKLTEKFFSYFDVAGGKDIRDVFRNIKVPKKITEAEQRTLGDLQVVPVAEQDERPEEEEAPELERPAPEDNSDFLKDLDDKIERLTHRNDEMEADESLKRKPLPTFSENQESEQSDSEEKKEE